MKRQDYEDFGPRDPDNDNPRREVQFFWDPLCDFGGYLKRIREQKKWTTRDAAAKLDVSQAYVSKLENQARDSPPRRELLERIADVYGLDLRQVMHEAGYRFTVPPALEIRLAVDESFHALVNHPRFRPTGFEPEHERYYAPKIKQQMVDLALKVARAIREDDFDLETWLCKKVDP
jgi:transcriptional regulator with XRE-family HTH domain